MPMHPVYENYTEEQLHELALAWVRKHGLPDGVASSIVLTPIADDHGNTVGEFYLKSDRADWVVPRKLFFSEDQATTVVAWIKASIAVSSGSDDQVLSHYGELNDLLLLGKAIFMLTGDLPVNQDDPCYHLVEEARKTYKNRPGSGPEDFLEVKFWRILRSMLGADPC